MKRKLLIKATFSLILPLALVIITVIVSPRVASAQYTSNKALEALEQGIEYYNQGDVDNAEFSYKEAIKEVLKNKEVDVLISAKQRLASLKESQGDIEKANQLSEEAEYGIKALGAIREPRPCGEPCPSGLTCAGDNCNTIGSGPLEKCKQCSPG